MKTMALMNIIRWSARIIGTLMVAFTLLIGIGEILVERTMTASAPNTYNMGYRTRRIIIGIMERRSGRNHLVASFNTIFTLLVAKK
jgi:hypothetical protein